MSGLVVSALSLVSLQMDSEDEDAPGGLGVMTGVVGGLGSLGPLAGAAAGLGAVGGVPLPGGPAGFVAAAALPPIPAIPAPPTSESASPPLDLLIKTPRSVAGTEAKSEPSPEQDPDAGPKVAEFYVKEYATKIERRIAHNPSA